MKPENFDRTDANILSELILNSKTPLRKIAKKVGISYVTVKNRIDKIEKAGIIQKYGIRIDYEKLGYDIHVLVEVRILKGKLIELEKKIARIRNVYAVYDTTGEFDATIFARFRNTRELDNFVKKVRSFEYTERTNTKMILNTIKYGNIRV